MAKAKRKAERDKNPKQRTTPEKQRRAASKRRENKPIPDAEPAATPAERPEAEEPDVGMPPDHQLGQRTRGMTPDQEVEERAREINPPVNPGDAQR